MDLTTLLPPERIDPADESALFALARLSNALYASEMNWEDDTPLWHSNLSDITHTLIVSLILPSTKKATVRYETRRKLDMNEPPKGDFQINLHRGSVEVVNLHGLWAAAMAALLPPEG